ncbi:MULTISPECIES: efflux RND transporter periplasmic adaptor subunit [Bartonella]|uniref:efflux RND transporter periplasmic adaptor subunit n=1 Tax=Bartonella TaxID=773 RepID=UPI0018DC1750|nr:MULTISPECIES: efflux RND transporter periplasmic adaptor subunit [Bartonella]MBI0168684.1 efflux RND transporter periplasmic adaptor subunit [Bartonella sp. W8167]MBI0175328.1 efflux RND transporter periplasmic adaptor subunit [Bartonella apis]MCT6825433.1 efflux RND transporter periplasmic adaptor subunit [Bartonella apis]MCT6860265.1 efflux RND transporter periplasmic adaptor subunit [Bartonella apis]MCT6887144.1 efflux RND transporter periplasmic adaptor subunit [Bartonella apis]
MTLLRKLSAALVVGVLSFGLVACGKQEKHMPPPSQASGKVIHQAEVPLNYEYAARVVAYRETEVRARVGGILLHRNFVEGSEVKQGEILFEIDPDKYEAAVASARAQVAQAQANYDQSVRDADRAEELVKQKVQSTSLRDQAFAKRDADEATLMQTKAELRTAELNLEYTKVAAPISGLTSREAVSEGSLIGTDPSSSLLTTITQFDPIYVNFSFADGEYDQIRHLMDEMQQRGEKIDNLKVIVRLGEGVDYPEQGTVDFTSPTIDKQTGTLGARAVIANPDRRLVPGMFVRVTVTGIKMANAMTIPESALVQNSGGQFVYLLKKPEAPKAGENAPQGAQPAAPAAANGQPQKATGRLMVVEQRPVKAVRKMQNGDWLIDSVKFDEKDKNKVVQGLRDGEEVVTEGQVYIEQGLMRIPQGQSLMVNVTDDAPQQAPDGGNAKASGPAQ